MSLGHDEGDLALKSAAITDRGCLHLLILLKNFSISERKKSNSLLF